MPSDESFIEKAEGFKKSGNEAFAKETWTDAVQSYSLGLAQVDRIVVDSSNSAAVVTLKTSLLSNRAACYLKLNRWKECQEDCTTALDLLQSSSSSSSTTNGTNVATLHSKLLYRRAKAEFMLANAKNDLATTNAMSNDLLQRAAKDLLTLLSDDPKNKEATTLLQTVRAQHSMQSQATNTPIAKTLDQVLQCSKEEASSSSSSKNENALHYIKVLLGLITNDAVSGSMELGRRGGVQLLLDLASKPPPITTTTSSAAKTSQSSPYKLQSLALSCLASAGSYPPFCRTYCQDIQPKILSIVQTYCQKEKEENSTDASDVIVSSLALYLRLLLHLDRDDPKSDVITTESKVDAHLMNQACLTTLALPDVRVVRATLDLLSTWTAGEDRDATIRASLAEHPGAEHDLPVPKTPAEVRSLEPRELSAYRKRAYQMKQRDQDWAQQRAFVFCKAGGIQTLLNCASQSLQQQQNVNLRREVNVVLGRLMAAISDENGIQSLVKPFLGTEKETDDEGLTIEEVFDEDEETKSKEEVEEELVASLTTLQQRAELTSALLLAKSEVGAWALSHGWDTAKEDLRTMITSKDRCSMFLASEVVSAAASVEKSRPMVAAMLRNGSLETLLGSDYREVRSGAASAIAKLGLSEKHTDEGEVVGLLQVAVDLLHDADDNGDGTPTDPKQASLASRFSQSAGATSSIDRGIEMINYLVSQTQVKEELAHGFKSNRSEASWTALERLVELASRPGSGESVSAYAMATIFMHMAVSSLTLKKESFAGKDISMEDYDQMQKLAKSKEEQDMEKEPEDTQNAVDERVRLMARANVPRALVQLMEGANDTTVEQALTALNRMAVETSVRGLLIQQGVLSACIKVERGDNPTAMGKKILRLARHCISKVLATSNPSLLTTSQRMGSIKPLIQLIRDSEGTDLQQFEALLALTNIAASDDETKDRIIAERGISTLSFAMFSSHEMVRRSATEAMCNLVPHPAMMEHLADPEHAGLWLAFAADHEENYECARAAAGCLAMASQDPDIAKTIVNLKKFHENVNCLLESGRLELMHRVLVMILNLLQQDDEECREAVIANGLSTFCRMYADSYHDGSKAAELDDITPAERGLLPVTIELAQEIVRQTE